MKFELDRVQSVKKEETGHFGVRKGSRFREMDSIDLITTPAL